MMTSAALAEKRVALVIGNSAYRNVARLTNPSNDAAVMAETFKKANFDSVDSRSDLTATDMRRALRDFGDKARDADIAVVYYAGHGIEVDGTNYLIPVDALLERDTDVFDEAFPLDRILVAVEPAKQLRLVILDACRDNPFAKTMKRTIGSRSVGRGLAKVEPSNPNTMIAFAAKAGFTASDGDNNSPFAKALTQHLTRPGLDLRKAFGFVRDDVLKATGNKQEPFVYGSLGGNDLALVPAVPAVASSSTAPADANYAIRRDYELAAQVGTLEAWDFFLSAYTEGFYAKLATAQRNKLLAEEARVAATEKVRSAADEQQRLAAEGARAAEQSKAAAATKAAEEARVQAEKKKALEDAKVAEAERVKAIAQARATEDARILADKKAAEEAKMAEAERAKAAALAKSAEDARIQAEKKKAEDARVADAKAAAASAKTAADAKAKASGADDNKPIGPVAALEPPDQDSDATARKNLAAPADIPRLLQVELRRVGCNTGAIDGSWNASAQRAMSLFNRNAGTKLDVKVASIDALDIVRGKTARICPLICEHGFKADGDKCVAITCKSGFAVGDDNTCERIEKPTAKQDKPDVNVRPEKKPAAVAAPSEPKPERSGGSPKDMAGLYAQCRATAMSKGGKGLNFHALDACARNGGHF
jgi:uncharacterized caspase-like protein